MGKCTEYLEQNKTLINLICGIAVALCAVGAFLFDFGALFRSPKQEVAVTPPSIVVADKNPDVVVDDDSITVSMLDQQGNTVSTVRISLGKDDFRQTKEPPSSTATKQHRLGDNDLGYKDLPPSEEKLAIPFGKVTKGFYIERNAIRADVTGCYHEFGKTKCVLELISATEKTYNLESLANIKLEVSYLPKPNIFDLDYTLHFQTPDAIRVTNNDVEIDNKNKQNEFVLKGHADMRFIIHFEDIPQSTTVLKDMVVSIQGFNLQIGDIPVAAQY